MLKEQILEKLKTIIHPEYKEDIVSLGMVENYVETEDEITIFIRTKKANDPVGNTIRKLSEMTISEIVKGAKKVTVQLAGKEKPAEVEINMLAEVKHIIAVASGKGGVGKSTVAANLAVTLSCAPMHSTGKLKLTIIWSRMPLDQWQ